MLSQPSGSLRIVKNLQSAVRLVAAETDFIVKDQIAAMTAVYSLFALQILDMQNSACFQSFTQRMAASKIMVIANQVEDMLPSVASL